jgi:epoxyqueuosine reductase
MKSSNEQLKFRTHVLPELQSRFGFEQIEMSDLRSPLTVDFYEKWLKRNQHGTMTYLESHLPIKKDVRHLNAELKSAIVVAQSYLQPPEDQVRTHPARLAMYAQSQDYHHWLKSKISNVITELQQQFPNEVFLPFVDSGPILERDLAYQNGLGWFGKNSCLIHPKYGSLFFIAEILCSIEVGQYALETIPDFCGTCSRCIDICPTKAINQDRSLKADHCISYLTIESKSIPPVELRSQIGDWFFGCDLCQTACPWNQKIFKRKSIADDRTSLDLNLQLSNEKRILVIQFFRKILNSSGKQIQKDFLGSPLSRGGAFGLKRNAMIVSANQKLIELKSDIEPYLKDQRLAELAQWSLNQL